MDIITHIQKRLGKRQLKVRRATLLMYFRGEINMSYKVARVFVDEFGGELDTWMLSKHKHSRNLFIKNMARDMGLLYFRKGRPRKEDLMMQEHVLSRIKDGQETEEGSD